MHRQRGPGRLLGDRNWIYVVVVGDIVAAVLHRRGVPRRDPDGVHPEFGEIGQFRAHSGDISDTVIVAIGEAAWIDLIDHRCPPPATWHWSGHHTKESRPAPTPTNNPMMEAIRTTWAALNWRCLVGSGECTRADLPPAMTLS